MKIKSTILWGLSNIAVEEAPLNLQLIKHEIFKLVIDHASGEIFSSPKARREAIDTMCKAFVNCNQD